MEHNEAYLTYQNVNELPFCASKEVCDRLKRVVSSSNPIRPTVNSNLEEGAVYYGVEDSSSLPYNVGRWGKNLTFIRDDTVPSQRGAFVFAKKNRHLLKRFSFHFHFLPYLPYIHWVRSGPTVVFPSVLCLLWLQNFSSLKKKLMLTAPVKSVHKFGFYIKKTHLFLRNFHCSFSAYHLSDSVTGLP